MHSIPREKLAREENVYVKQDC